MKIILTIVATIVVVLFSIQNFYHVPLYIFSGKPIQIRLIFVIAVSGSFGYLLHYIMNIPREEAIKKKMKHLVREHQRLTQRTNGSNGMKRERRRNY